MIIGFFRVLYLFGPLLALALVLMPHRRELSWSLWIIALAVTGFHWWAYLSAVGENAINLNTVGVASWTPMLVTTLGAYFTRDRWEGLHENVKMTRSVVAGICLAITLAGYFVTR